MDKFEFTVNGETFFADQQAVDAAVLLQIAFVGKAIGADSDKTGYVPRVPDPDVTFVSPFVRETGLPLLGLTMGSDGVWSTRFWQQTGLGQIVPAHCTDVRRVGPRRTQADYPPGAHRIEAQIKVLSRRSGTHGVRLRMPTA